MNCNFNVRNVQLVDHIGSDANIPGTIYVTTSHFVFKADESGKEIWVCSIFAVFNNFITNLGCE
jgi:hypothetical protein